MGVVLLHQQNLLYRENRNLHVLHIGLHKFAVPHKNIQKCGLRRLWWVTIVAIEKDVWKHWNKKQSVKQCPVNEFQTAESLV